MGTMEATIMNIVWKKILGRIKKDGKKRQKLRGRSDMAIPGTYNLKLVYTPVTEILLTVLQKCIVHLCSCKVKQ